MRATLSDMVSEHVEAAPGDLGPTVLGAMFVPAVIWWLENGRPTSPRLIAEETGRLASVVIAEQKRAAAAAAP